VCWLLLLMANGHTVVMSSIFFGDVRAGLASSFFTVIALSE